MDERFLQQLVADYLEKSSLLKTLESFYQESGMAETRPPPVHIEEIAAKLQLPVDGNESKSVLGYLIDNYLRDCALRMRESPNSMMEKLLARPKPSRPFNSRKSSHTNTSTGLTFHHSQGLGLDKVQCRCGIYISSTHLL